MTNHQHQRTTMKATQAVAFPIFNGQEVTTITDENGNPWWVAKEVCDILGIANSRDAVSGLDDDEKDVVITDTPGGQQSTTVINEPGLYSLILRSRKPEAKAFKRWVNHEVLPIIRKTGGYIILKRVCVL